MAAQPINSWKLTGASHVLAAAVIANFVLVGSSGRAWAQQAPAAPVSSIPGLVVTTPPQPAAPPAGMPGLLIAPPSPPPGAAPAPKPAEAVRPKPKPRTAKPSSAGPSEARGPAAHSIAALVNDEPITGFAVEQRAAFMSLSGNFQDRARANLKAIAENPATNERLKAMLEDTIRSNPGKSRDHIIKVFEERKKAFVQSLQQQAVSSAKASLVPTYRKKALEELIEERLKLQEAKRLTIAVSEDDVQKAFKGVAERNKMTPDQFVAYIRQQGGDATVMKERFRAQIAWREVIRRRYGHQINVSGRDVDRLVASSGPSEETLELQLQKITISLPGKIDQKVMAQGLADADGLRRQFGGCKSTSGLVKGQANAKFEDLGYRKASTVNEPTRSLLVSARDGEMVPPALTGSGVELYAVCGRRTVKVTDEKRQAAENELTMKEFERLAQRHMADLRRDARIEMR